VTITGGGSTSPSNSCSTLFGYATLVGNTYGGGTSTPADELTAVMNIAKAPANQATNIYNMAPTTPAFLPTLTAAPTDWSLAIWYPVTLGGVAATTSWPLGVALDANDNVYVLAQDVQTTPTESQLSGFTTNGTASWNTGVNKNLCNPVNLAADANGYIWYANHESSTGGCNGDSTAANAGIYGFTTSGPTISSPTYTIAKTTSSPNNVAIDRFNNVWQSKSSTSSQSIFIFPPPYTVTPSLPKYTLVASGGMSVDANQNGWGFTNNASAAGSLFVLANQGSPTVPAYGTGNTGGNLYPNSLFSSISGQSSSASGFSTGSFDSAGNAWVASNDVVSKVTASSTVTPSSVTITSFQCTTCTLLTFNYTTAISTAYSIGQIFTASLFHTTQGKVWNGNYFQIPNSASDTTTALVKSTLCSSSGTGVPCTLAVTTLCATGATCTGISSTSDNTGVLTANAPINTFASGTSIATTAVNPSNIATDGVNTLWLDDDTNVGSVYYVVPSTPLSQKLNPCYLPSAATVCQTVGTATGGMTYGGRLAIDSTGSVWTVSGTTSSLIQIIGSAAPTWPLLAYTTYGVKPQ
jgi:hypothetical protein